MVSFTHLLTLGLLPLSAVCASYINSTPSYISTLPLNAQGLLSESMEWMDGFYDPSAGYLFDESAWYAVGLLARNNGTDLQEALKILTNVVNAQFKDPRDQW
jgi:hypothetical protein